MSEKSENRSWRGWRILGLSFLYLIAAEIPLYTGLNHPGITGYKRAMLEDMVYGQAYKPYVKRQLVPLIVRAGKGIMPSVLEEKFKKKFANSELAKRLNWPIEYASEFLLSLVIMYGSLIGFLLVFRCFLLLFFTMPSGLSHLLVLTVGIGLPVTFRGQVAIYDFSQLLLFTAALVLLFQRRWVLFYPTYILACINKETSILIPMVFACWLGVRVLRRPEVWHLLCQILVGSGICLTISLIFHNNPGVDTEWHLHRNITMPFGLVGWFRIVVLVVAVIFCLWRLHESPCFLRRGFVATLPVLLCAAFFWADIEELRDYYEALPFIVGLALVTVSRQLGISPRASLDGVDGAEC